MVWALKIRVPERGIFMNHSEVKMWVNDYLDLFLYAKSMNDLLWQQEIIEILQNFHYFIGKEKTSPDFNNHSENFKQN